MRETGAGQQPLTLEKGVATFLDGLSGKNRSQATIRAYQTDLLQFLTFLHETNVLITAPQDVQKIDILEYFSHLAKKALSRRSVPQLCFEQNLRSFVPLLLAFSTN